MQTVATIPVSKPYCGDEEKQAVLAVLESGQLSQGRVVEEFEAGFAALCGVRHAVALSSGTAALHLALLAYGIGDGDEVIVPPLTFIATANAVLHAGARPVFVDVDPISYNLDPELVEAAITPRTRAIIPVHLYGLPADMGALLDIARRHDLRVIEDAAQAVGALLDGRPAGSLGDSAAFSLYPTKNITSGEGGMVTTDDDAVAERIRMLRHHGASQRYHHEVLGYNFRMTDLHAAVGLAQLGRLGGFTRARRANATFLSRNLAGLAGVGLPVERPGTQHVYHQYVVRIERNRDGFADQLAEYGVGSAVHYPTPVHRQPLYRTLGYDVAMPVSERLANQVLSLPVHPLLTEAELERVVHAVREASA